MRSPTLLGLVESATGSSVTVGLLSETLSGVVYIEGEGHRVGQVGGFVRIPQGFSNLYGIITQAGVAAAPVQLGDPESGRRWLTVEIVGEGTANKKFSRGVFSYPTIGDEVHIVTQSDLWVIYGSSDTREYVEIGSLSSSRSIPARIDVNRLVTRHCAIVGATGSGKSTTVAGVLHRLSDGSRFPSSRIILLDLHGEYAEAFGDSGRVFRSGADEGRGGCSLAIPFWALTFDELVPLAFGSLDDMPRGRVIDWITERKRDRVRSDLSRTVDPEIVTVDSPVPFSLHQLWYDLRWEIDATYPKSMEQTKENAQIEDSGDPERLRPARFKPFDGSKIIQSRSTLNIRRQLEVLGSRLRDPRLGFLFAPGAWAPALDGSPRSDLDELLSLWLGSGKGEHRPVTILDLSGVPTSVLTALVGALVRLLFDALFWGKKLSEGGRERPLLLVMEEAHLYLSKADGAAGLAVKRVVKEGRKYGIGAMIVSQRPSEIDSTILSQCGTLIAMRMGNSQDRAHVASATNEGLKDLLDLLPTLRTGEAIIVGEAVHLPTRTMIHRPANGMQPSSSDPRIVEIEYGDEESGPGGWDRSREPTDYSDLLVAWRRQDSTLR